MKRRFEFVEYDGTDVVFQEEVSAVKDPMLYCIRVDKGALKSIGWKEPADIFVQITVAKPVEIKPEKVTASQKKNNTSREPLDDFLTKNADNLPFDI